MRDDLDATRIRAEEAKQLLENRLFREAFEGVAEYLHQAALGCDPDNKDKAQRIVLSQQLLASIKQEIVRKVEDGEMAQIQMAQIEKRKLFRMFER